MTTPDPIAGAIEALELAREFISNGLEFGYIPRRIHATEITVPPEIDAAISALRAYRPAPAAEGDSTWPPLPMETAPRDGTILRLFTRFAEHPLSPENDGPQWTIGQNWRDFNERDEWLAAGWNGTQDCYTTETVTPIGWLPFHATNAALIEALRQIEEYREAYKEAEAERPAPAPDELREAVEKAVAEMENAAQFIRADWEPRIADGFKTEAEKRLVTARGLKAVAAILRAALSRLPVADDGWQPMETAPKGRPLLLFARCKTAIAPGIVVGWWIEDLGWIECCFDGNSPVGLVPVRWQRLPAFPALPVEERE